MSGRYFEEAGEPNEKKHKCKKCSAGKVVRWEYTIQAWMCPFCGTIDLTLSGKENEKTNSH